MSASVSAAVGMPGEQPAEEPFEARWDERNRLFRVWNNESEAWASVPGFTDERVAQAVAQSLTAPPAKGGKKTSRST